MSLPSGYKQLEYIQSSGTQWIDTGVKPNQNTKVEMKVSTTEGTSSNVPYLFGAQDNNNYFVATWVLGFGYSLVTSGIDLYDGVAHDVKVENGVLYKDGTAIAHGQASTFNISVSIGLFAVHSTKISDAFGVCKVYSCKIYDNGVLVRDFTPCKNADGVVGVWDDVNSSFYSNAGTGTFIAGPVVNLGGIFVKVNGVWKQIDNITVNVN